MKYIKLGSTGIDVSRICLGCMSYGSSTRGSHDWALEEAESRPFIQQALDAGINFFDTANVYQGYDRVRSETEVSEGKVAENILVRDS